MDFNLKTYQHLADKHLKYQFALYPIVFDMDPALQLALIQCHQSNTDTMFSLRKVIDLKNVNDVYSLSRTMLESVVNMGVLVTGEIEDGQQRFNDFKYLETYRTFEHLKQVDPDFTGKIYSSDDIEAISNGRDSFVSKYGNINNWCGKNLIERIKIIDKNFPQTCSTNRFYEYLYCQVYRKGSGAIHKTSAGLDKSTIWKRSNGLIAPKPNMNHLIFASIHSLIVYLSSIRFIGQQIVKKKEETESYYQNETSRIVAGRTKSN